MTSAMYPDGLSGWAICQMEGCLGPNCRRCGSVDYRLLGYLGAIAKWARVWGISKEEAEKRIENRADALLEVADGRQHAAP